jgi:hypothetical protein
VAHEQIDAACGAAGKRTPWRIRKHDTVDYG